MEHASNAHDAVRVRVRLNAPFWSRRRQPTGDPASLPPVYSSWRRGQPGTAPASRPFGVRSKRPQVVFGVGTSVVTAVGVVDDAVCEHEDAQRHQLLPADDIDAFTPGSFHPMRSL